ncbi:MAG: HIT family protein [Pseudomonadota bacterium]
MSETGPSSYDDTNIFAKILRGELPSHTVLETETMKVIMDVMPQADGHALVIPKAPSRNLLDADPIIFADLMHTVRTMSQAAMRAFEADGVIVQQFNEAPAGQTVFHLHVHVIPRSEGVALQRHSSGMADPDVLAAHAEKYRLALKELGA